MTFNRIQMLSNKPIRIARDKQDSYLFVQGPTIGQVYEDDKLFLATQILIMPEKELKNFLNLKDSKLNKLELLTLLLTNYKEKDDILEKFKQIILGLYIKDNKLYIDSELLKQQEVDRIESILQIIMGQKVEKKEDEPELSPQEKRLKDLEDKVKAKKQKQEPEREDENGIENIIIAVIYEFGFDFEKIMNMNYFTLIWYYSYTGKLHVYRINQQAISSGMVKKINTDYFTSLK